MMIYILSLTFLFIVRCRFPRNKSIADVIRSRYGTDTVRKLRKFEKLDFKIRKNIADLEFLEKCIYHSITPKFLNFKLANIKLRKTATYKKCQELLLNEELFHKQKVLSKQQKNFDLVKRSLSNSLSHIDFLHVSCLFLAGNDRKLTQVKLTHERKFQRLKADATLTCNDPDKVIFNYSSYQLNESEKNLLAKGLNYCLPPQSLNYADFLLPFELCFRKTTICDISAEHRERIKTDMKHISLSTLESYDFYKELNITVEELDILESLRSNKNIIVQKSDKGNSVVILNKSDYIKKMEAMLADESKFTNHHVGDGKELNGMLGEIQTVVDFLKQLKKSGSISQKVYNTLYPHGSHPGIMYGLAKVHKPLVNGTPKLRPILSALNTSTYKWAKFFVPHLRSLTTNEYTVTDSFEFCKEIQNQDSSLYMCSLDVDSLFTNVPLDETLDICVEKLRENNTKIESLSTTQIRDMLDITTKTSTILFNKNYYSQIDGVAMGSPLGPTLANAFLCSQEGKWLDACPAEFKPVYYRRYVDDIFVLFRSPDHLLPFVDYLNTKHGNIHFTYEQEVDGKFSFLDIGISRDDNKFVTDVFRKETFSGVYTNFSSFIPDNYKLGLVRTLLFRSFSLVSNFSKFHLEIVKLKEILKKNGYPSGIIDSGIRMFFNSLYTEKQVHLTAPKLDVQLVLPFLGHTSLKIKKQLVATFSKFLPACKLSIVFKVSNRFSGFLKFKERVPKQLSSHLIYKFVCGRCKATYIGKTFRHMGVRTAEHQGISPRTGKVVQGTCTTAVRQHQLECSNCQAKPNDFTILGYESNEYLLETKENIFISRDNPTINIKVWNQELLLF